MNDIEGLPPGTKIGPIICVEMDRGCPQVTAQLEPDNIYGVLDLASLPIPDGYERAGEKPEEWFRSAEAADVQACHSRQAGRVSAEGRPARGMGERGGGAV